MNATCKIKGFPLYREATTLPQPIDALLPYLPEGAAVSLTIIRESGMPACYLSAPVVSAQALAAVLGAAACLAETAAPPKRAPVRTLVLRDTGVAVGGDTPLRGLLLSPIASALRFGDVCRMLEGTQDGTGLTLFVENAGPLRGGLRRMLEQSGGEGARQMLDAPSVCRACIAVFGSAPDCALVAGAVAGAGGLRQRQIAPVACEAESVFGALGRVNAAGMAQFLFTREEVRLLARVTAAGVPGGLPVNLDTLPGEARLLLPGDEKNGIPLGVTAGGKPVFLPLSDLCRHVFIGGAPGSGKGNLLFSTCFFLAKRGIPLLAIESAKAEFHYLGKGVPGLNTFRPKAGEYCFNPFLLPKGVKLADYKPALQQMLRTAFRLDGPLEELFNTTLERCFARSGYSDDTMGGDPGTAPFGLNEFIGTFEELLRTDVRYAAKTGADIRTAGLVRLQKLFSLNRGVFDTVGGVPAEALITGANVLQLNSLTSVEAKQLFATLLLISIGAVLRLTKHTSPSLRLVIVLDEAHNLLNAAANAAGETYSFAEDFLALLLELRSLGVGFIISDQSADNLPPMFSAICENKIFLGASPASGVGSNLQYLHMDEAGLDHLHLLRVGDGLYTNSNLPHAAYFHAPNVIDLFGLEQPCNARNRYLELHPETLLRSYRECAFCPNAAGCTTACKAKGASSALRLAEHGTAFARLFTVGAADVAGAPFKEAFGRQSAALFFDAHRYAGDDDGVYLCSIVNFIRAFNREHARKLPTENLVQSAAAFRRQLKKKKEKKGA